MASAENASPTVTVCRAQTATERERALAIRFEVFVAEQHVSPEEELDGIDDACLHYLAFSGTESVATARLIPKGEIAKIGRVAVLKRFRGRGVGLAMMRAVLADARATGFTHAALDSQTYAVPFYAKMGFVAEGAEFLDAGIPHFHMSLPLSGPERSS